MQPPVEISDRSEYRHRMNELLTIDKRRTVIVTVDMQNDYLDMQLATAPVAPEEAARVIAGTQRLLEFARSEAIPVIHAYVKRRPVEVERGFESHPLVSISQRARCSQNAQAEARRGPDRVEGTPQAELPALLVGPGDVHVTTKRVMDSFHGTDLDTLVGRVFKAETVVLTGINTDTCVMATTFAAGNRGYRPVVISDCVASMRGRDQHWMALEIISRSIAWVLTVDEFMAKVEAGQTLK
ncbi:MAG: cysteine hydrolase family protein [Syntrophales bacterium]